MKFHPLSPMSDEWVNWFVDKFDMKLCDLYGSEYGFKRTGCVCCPFSLDLEKQLDTLEKLLPNERKRAEYIWKPVYDEYRRIGYRLKGKTE